MKTVIRAVFVTVMAAIASTALAQTYAPMVTMSVTTPDGQTHEVSARESSVATVKANDGTVYEVRPTIHDEPFTTVTVTIFKAATATESTSQVGEVQAKKGAAPVETKSKPAFKVAIKNIEAAKAAK